MLKRLRIKFILINMMMAVLVLATTFGVVCYLNYASSVNSVYGQLNTVLARVASSMIEQIEDVRSINLQTPSPIDDGDEAGLAANANLSANSNANSGEDAATAATSDKTADAENANSGRTTASTSVGAIIYDETTFTPSAPNESIVPAPSIGTIAGGATQSPSPTILVAVYRISDQGFYTTIPDFSIASINESVLLRANTIVEKSDKNYGSLPEFDLCYQRMPISDGLIVAYADASSTHSWKDLAMMLTGVGIAALALFFLINLFFSRWALRPVAQSMKQQQQFTADASHELKTPLTVILANMSILESQPESTVEDQMQWIESTQTEATRMQLLVNEMLSLARPKEDKPVEVAAESQDHVDIDFSDLVEGEVLQFESVAFERGIDMEGKIEQGLHVNGDAERLGRMVSTLIDNACKYTPDDGSVTISLTTAASSTLKGSGSFASKDAAPGSKSRTGRASRMGRHSKNAAGRTKSVSKNECIVLKVQNEGAPISEEDLPHLFDRFYRADKARTSGKGGYGLGLAIGREIAREHDGDITVTSTEKEGTVFTVALPLLSK